MQQLKLDLNPRKKVSGMKEVFKAILAGEVSQILFFKWVRARERAEYYKGYNAGYEECRSEPRGRSNHYVPENY